MCNALRGRATQEAAMPVDIVRLQLPDTEGWGDLIRTWGGLLDRYEELSAADYDIAYCHKENTLTAMLAAAAWKR